MAAEKLLSCDEPRAGKGSPGIEFPQLPAGAVSSFPPVQPIPPDVRVLVPSVLTAVTLAFTPVAAQSVPSPATEKPAADALTRQRESVRKQAASAAGSNAGGSAAAAPADSFFTVPWPTSLVMPGADCDPMPQKDLDTLIRDASQREKLKPDLIKAVITQESGAKPCAVSAKGAMGLMQLMPEVAEQMHVADPFDPKESVDAGVKLLKQLIDKYKGNTTLALSAYNAGEKRVDQAGGIPDIPETQNYVKSISREAGAVPASSDPPSPR